MNDRIRVVISTHIGAPWGGVDTLYSDLFRSRFGELVHLYYVDNHPGVGAFSQSGRLSQSNLASALTYYAHFVALLLRVRPHVVHIATAYGLSFVKQGIAVVLAKALRTRVVLAPHCSYARLLPNTGLWRAYSRFVLRRCNGLIALSKEWLALRQWLPGCLVEYLPNAIDLKPYRDLSRPRAKDEGSGVRILFLGHIGQDKGSFDLVEAARQLKRTLVPIPWHIELRGETLLPGELEQVQRRINESVLQEQVHIRPPVFDADKVACLARADLFVLPSHHEGMPVSLIEAMAAGLPVVATNVGGIPDLVTDGENGLLVPPGQPTVLAEALARLMRDPGTRTRMGLAGRQMAIERHDLDASVPDLVMFHERVAAGS
jgi:glycosyltransferase involved in cell wall biosynthesis